MGNSRHTREPVTLPATVLAELEAVVGRDGLIVEQSQLQTYECDGLTAIRTAPSAVVLPLSTEQVQTVVRVCARYENPFVARGAGLSGGAMPARGGSVISFAR
jgi:glycolate oxidase